MRYSTIISALDMFDHHLADDWVIIDSRFSLQDPNIGLLSYQKSHIPGAIFADIEKDLSGAISPGITGRHPLPDVIDLTKRFSEWGIDQTVQVVVYDDDCGAYAARLWWLLQWLGHDAVAILDGGWQKWIEAGYPGERKVIPKAPKLFSPQINHALWINADQVAKILDEEAWQLIDARSADRYHGVNETIDPIAGHIPGAISIPYTQNLTDEGVFKSPADLKKLYAKKPGDLQTEKTVMYCGSGVTAAMNVIAMKHAGLGMCKLYPGSWSEWITNPMRPIVAKAI